MTRAYARVICVRLVGFAVECGVWSELMPCAQGKGLSGVRGCTCRASCTGHVGTRTRYNPL